jgi:hypothetical protein
LHTATLVKRDQSDRVLYRRRLGMKVGVWMDE